MPGLKYRIAFYIIAVATYVAPAISYAAAPRNLVELANMLANLFNSGATFLILLAFILYLGGVTVFLYRKESGEVWGKEFRALILWGIAALFVMVSIWGIIKLLQETLFGNNGSPANSAGGSGQLQFPASTEI